MGKTIHTNHGDLETPFFMPDATRAGVRGLPMEHIASAGIDAMCMNTYHLMLRPGVETVKEAGGLHKFSGWGGPILTDSGGYQVFSLIHANPKLGKITEEGAKFRDVYSGSWHMLTPELSIQIQCDLGVDMMVILDDVRPNDRPKKEMDEAVERTVRWSKRAWAEYKRQWEERGWTEESRPKIFAVVQGGPYIELRQKCLDGLVETGEWDGYGFGGLHIDDNGVMMDELVEGVAKMLPDDRLKFALGVGKPADIRKFESYGWDMFDCTLPTRDGRHGRAYLWNSGDVAIENINASSNTHVAEPIEGGCECGCTKYRRGYLRHLLQVADQAAGAVIMRHNLHVYAKLMTELRLR